MTTDKIALELEKREVVGKGLGQLRRAGVVPAVLHNHGKDSIHVMGDAMLLSRAYVRAGKHHPVDLKIDGKQYLALIKDADFEPRKHQLRHLVFQAIKQNETTTAEIPVVLEGEEIPAEKKGLLVLTQADVVEVEALPKDLPSQLVVDATTLENEGDHLYVSDLKVPEGVKVLTEAESSLAVVEMPRDQIAEADAAAAALAEDQDKPVADETSSDADSAEQDSKEEDKPEES